VNDLYPQISASLFQTLPILVLIVAGIGVLVADVLLPRASRWLLSWLSLLGVALAFIALDFVVGPAGREALPLHSYFGVLRSNYLVFLAQNVILAAGAFVILISPRYVGERRIPLGEYYGLLLLAVMAMLALAASTELLTVFLNLELLSITLYVLTGIENRNLRSGEAAFKYFLLGSFAAAFLLLGIAFVFGATGETRYDAIRQVLVDGTAQPRLLAIGFCLMLVGFGFKLSLAPFHMYAPDVYEGAPTTTASLIATGTKVAGFAALFHLIELAAAWSDAAGGLWLALYAVALASMIVGNVGAVVQPNIKRMLAYSSIAHSGYTIVPMVVMLQRPDLIADARDAVAYYMLAYTVMTLLAFGVPAVLGPAGESRIAQYAGLHRRSPMLACVMALAMVSLMGIPPTIGFFGKFQLFAVAVQGDHIWLAVLGVLASVASVYYYLRVIVTMYMEEPATAGEELESRRLDGVNAFALTACSVCVFLFVVFQSLYLFGV